MLPNPEKYLFDMMDSCQFLVEFVKDKSLENLRMDRGFRSAVERELQIIGEALHVLSKNNPAVAEKISDYKRIIRFRHILVHGYDVVDADITWVILKEKVPLLLHELIELSKKIG